MVIYDSELRLFEPMSIQCRKIKANRFTKAGLEIIKDCMAIEFYLCTSCKIHMWRRTSGPVSGQSSMMSTESVWVERWCRRETKAHITPLKDSCCLCCHECCKETLAYCVCQPVGDIRFARIRFILYVWLFQVIIERKWCAFDAVFDQTMVLLLSPRVDQAQLFSQTQSID